METVDEVRAGHSRLPSLNQNFTRHRSLLILRKSWYWVVVCALVFAVVSLGLSLTTRPTYESTATLYVTSGNDANSQSAYQGSLASEQRVASYAELVRSDAVVKSALAKQRLPLSVDEAQSMLVAVGSPDTVLLRVNARGHDPVVAASLANAVSNSLVDFVQSLERPSSGGAPLARVTVITPASPDAKRVSPKTSRNALLGLLVGVIVGFVGLAFRVRFDGRVRDESDVRASLGSEVPILASIPNDATLSGGGHIAGFGADAASSAEAFRLLRTNLAFIDVDQPPKVVLITSSGAQEGKTTTALSLAVALAEAGSSVVLVDADLRRPAVAERLHIESSVGLSTALRAEVRVEDLVQTTDNKNLVVLASGEFPPNPTELLGSRKTQRVIGELAERYDYVLIDSPPILPVADAAVLSLCVSGVVLAVRSGQTLVSDLRAAAVQIADTFQAPLLGVLLNDVDPHLRGYETYRQYRAER